MSTYGFETKANKTYIAKVVDKVEQDVAKVIPTPFSLDIEIEEKEIFNNIVNNYQISLGRNITKGLKYAITGELLDIITPILSRASLLIISYIRLNVIYNSNFVEMTEKDFIGYSGMRSRSFYEAIDELIKHKVISRTTRKSIYVVNHNMLFKGNVGEFITKYKIKYPEPCKLDSNGKVILDR